MPDPSAPNEPSVWDQLDDTPASPAPEPEVAPEPTPEPTVWDSLKEPAEVVTVGDPEPIPQAEPAIPHASDWDADAIEKAGMPELAADIRNYQSTVRGNEDRVTGRKEAVDLIVKRGGRAYGRFRAKSVGGMVEELKGAYLHAVWRQHDIKPSDWDAPEDRGGPPAAFRKDVMQAVEDMAMRKVYGIVGTDPSRKNAIVDLDPQETMRKIKAGETGLGWLVTNSPAFWAVRAGQSTTSQAAKDEMGEWAYDKVNTLFGTDWEWDKGQTPEDVMRRSLAPLWAIMQPGGRSAHATDTEIGPNGVKRVKGETPVLGMAKEGSLSWFFRAGPFSAIGAAAFNPAIIGPSHSDEESELSEWTIAHPFQRVWEGWGSDEHIRRIYVDGYDITQETKNVGDFAGWLFPAIDDTWLEKVFGFTGMMGLIMFEPDLTALTLGILKPFKLAAKLVKPGARMVRSTYRPALERWLRMADDGMDLGDIEATMRPYTAEWGLFQMHKMPYVQRLMVEGGDVGIDNLSRLNMLKNEDSILAGLEASMRVVDDDLAKTMAESERVAVRSEAAAVELGRARKILKDSNAVEKAGQALVRQTEETATLHAALANTAKELGTSIGEILRAEQAMPALIARGKKAMEAKYREIEAMLGGPMSHGAIAKFISEAAPEDASVMLRLIDEASGLKNAWTADASRLAAYTLAAKAYSVSFDSTREYAARLQRIAARAGLELPDTVTRLLGVPAKGDNFNAWWRRAVHGASAELRSNVRGVAGSGVARMRRAGFAAKDAAEGALEDAAAAAARNRTRMAGGMARRAGLESHMGNIAGGGSVELFMAGVRETLSRTNTFARMMDEGMDALEVGVQMSKRQEKALRLVARGFKGADLAAELGFKGKNAEAKAARLVASAERAVEIATPSITSGVVGGHLTKKTTSVARQVSRDILEEVGERYGREFMDEAVAQTPRIWQYIGRDLTGDLAQEARTAFFEVEKLARNLRRQSRLADFDILRSSLQTIRDMPSGDMARGLGLQHWLAWGLRLGGTLSRTFDPLLSRGLANSPESVKAIFRNMFEDKHAGENAIDAISRQAGAGIADPVARGEAVKVAIEKFLTTSTRFQDGQSLITANLGPMTIADRGLSYLKMLVRAGDEAAIASDITIATLARAAAPSGMAGAAGSATATARIVKLIQTAGSGAEFLTAAASRSMSSMHLKHGAIDRAEVVNRFVYRAIMQASAMHGAVEDMVKAGLARRINPASGTAMDFITGSLPRDLSSGVTREGIEGARAAMSAFNVGINEAVKTGKVERLFTASTTARNQILRIAELNGRMIEVPAYLKKALDDIPRGLAKELQQFDYPDPVARRVFNELGRLWSMTVVNGHKLPRLAHFGATLVGNFAQEWQVVGVRSAIKHQAGAIIPHINPLHAIPIIGRQVGPAAENWARNNSALHWLFNRSLDDVMTGNPKTILDTDVGKMGADEMLNWARKAGAEESISSQALHEMLSRVPRERLKYMGMEDLAQLGPRAQKAAEVGEKAFKAVVEPSFWVKQMTEYMEAIQFRVRTHIYIDARTGDLPGRAGEMLSHEAAGKLMRDSMFDWMLGLPRWEAESFGRIMAFWTYRRLAMRQIGGALAESMSDSVPIWRALTGNTALGRTRKLGAMSNQLAETVYWTDPEETLDDEEQKIEFGRRHFPWWRDAESIILGRKLEPHREMWYSDVAGKAVTYESLILPGLTTIDHLYLTNLIMQTSIAGTVHAGQSMGAFGDVAAMPVDQMWENSIDTFTDMMLPGIGETMNDALRPLQGRAKHQSVKGVPVPQNTAMMLQRLGWEDFVAVVKDEDGRLRYSADPNALQVAGRLVAKMPHVHDLGRYWGAFDNPEIGHSVVPWAGEAMLRLSGLARYATMDPEKDLEYDEKTEYYDFEDTLKSARGAAGSALGM